MEKLAFNMIKGTVLNWRIEGLIDDDNDPMQEETDPTDESMSHPGQTERR